MVLLGTEKLNFLAGWCCNAFWELFVLLCRFPAIKLSIYRYRFFLLFGSHFWSEDRSTNWFMFVLKVTQGKIPGLDSGLWTLDSNSLIKILTNYSKMGVTGLCDSNVRDICTFAVLY